MYIPNYSCANAHSTAVCYTSNGAEWLCQLPRKQISCGQHGAHLGPVGPRWVTRWPHELCYQGRSYRGAAGPHGSGVVRLSATWSTTTRRDAQTTAWLHCHMAESYWDAREHIMPPIYIQISSQKNSFCRITIRPRHDAIWCRCSSLYFSPVTVCISYREM